MLSIEEKLFGEKWVILRLKGDLDEIEINTLYNYLSSCPMNNNSNLIINLDKVEEVDYFAIGFLIARRDFYKKNNGDLKLVSTNSVIEKLLEVMNISSYLEMYKSESEAINSFDV